MTLDELMAAYPHGSRWRVGGPRFGEAVVCGWMVEPPAGRDHEKYPRVEVYERWDGDTLAFRNSWEPHELHPMPEPCPITEPTTLHHSPITGLWCHEGERREEQLSCRDGRVILHPAEPGATEGRYTWEGTP